MVDRSSSKRCALIRIQLAVFLSLYNKKRVSNLIGKGLSCRESRYRIVADLTRMYLFTMFTVQLVFTATRC